MFRFAKNILLNGVRIVTYHHFCVEPCPATRQMEMATDPEVFERQLDYFQHHYNIIDLEQLLSGTISPNSLLITIDDAYRSVLDVAAPLLLARGMPVLFFVNSKPIIENFIPIENVVSYCVSKLGIDETTRCLFDARRSVTSYAELTGTMLACLSLSELEVCKSKLFRRLGTSEAELHEALDLFLRPGDLSRLVDFGFEIANHTASHSRCRLLSDDELVSEIVGAKDALETLSNQTVRAFGFPWGQERDATPAVLEAARASGHRVNFLMHGRCNHDRPDPDIWYRVLVTNQQDATLRTALEVLPRLRSIRHTGQRFWSR